MEPDHDPVPLHARVRWGTVAPLTVLVVAAALAVLWPQLASEPAPLPDAAPTPVAGSPVVPPESVGGTLREPMRGPADPAAEAAAATGAEEGDRASRGESRTAGADEPGADEDDVSRRAEEDRRDAPRSGGRRHARKTGGASRSGEKRRAKKKAAPAPLPAAPAGAVPSPPAPAPAPSPAPPPPVLPPEELYP